MPLVVPTNNEFASCLGCCPQGPMLLAFVRLQPGIRAGRLLSGVGLQRSGFKLNCSSLR